MCIVFEMRRQVQWLIFVRLPNFEYICGVTENTLVGCDREHFGESVMSDREEKKDKLNDS